MTEELKKPSEIEHTAYVEGCTTIQIENADLKALVTLLSITKDLYAKIALNAMDEGNKDNIVIYSTRAKLASAFAEKLADFTALGEPTSREIH